MTSKISLGQLESHLWGYANILRGMEDCHWNDVRAVTSNVGNAMMQRAMRETEKANPDIS